MHDDQLLERLRKEIEGDMAPVRPLLPPTVRALVPTAACVALGGLVILTAGVRGDVSAVGGWRLMSVTLLAVGISAALFAISFRWSVPAMGGSPSAALACASGALLAQVLVTAAILGRSALSPPPSREWVVGLACVAGIALVSLAPLGAAAALLLRGLTPRWRAAFALSGLASGLEAEAMWRVHCPYSTWAHVLPFHWGPLLAAVLVAVAGAAWIHRRGSLRERRIDYPADR